MDTSETRIRPLKPRFPAPQPSSMLHQILDRGSTGTLPDTYKQFVPGTERNEDFDADLREGQEAEAAFHDILYNSTIEIKRDKVVFVTGNVAIEYSSAGRASGIMATQATHWTVMLPNGVFITLPLPVLRRIFDEHYRDESRRVPTCNGKNRAVLVPVERLVWPVARPVWRGIRAREAKA